MIRIKAVSDSDGYFRFDRVVRMLLSSEQIYLLTIAPYMPMRGVQSVCRPRPLGRLLPV